MPKTSTRPYDVAEHLRTPREMALYLDACIEETMAMLPSLPRRWEMLHVRRA